MNFEAVGVDPTIMGIGPDAIPTTLKSVGLCIPMKLQLDPWKVIVNGGSMAILHHLRATKTAAANDGEDEFDELYEFRFTMLPVMKIGESGSLKLPHKVNRVDFNNSEGNLGTTNAVLDLLCMTLPISCWKEFFDCKELYKSVNPYDAVAYGAAVMAANLCDNQSSIRIAVFQGERSRSTDNHLLGEFSICGIPPAPKGVGSTLVCFEIDANGILNVTAGIISTGKMEKLIITNKHRRLSCEEIERMVKDAEKYKHEDQEYKKKADEYIALEDCLYKMMKKIKERSIGNNHVLEEIKRVMADTTTWLEDNRAAPFAELELKKFCLSGKLTNLGKSIRIHLENQLRGLEVYAAFTHLRFMDDVELVTTINDETLNKHVDQVGSMLIGPKGVKSSKKVMAGEYFAFYQQVVLGVMSRIGICCSIHSPHSPYFFLDEGALPDWSNIRHCHCGVISQ
ncbi:putative heat shock protein 70 family protein [Tanacetum coccineum]